jgi:hypothetical protein
MDFKKAFNIGYIVFLIILALIYFIIPSENTLIAILTLCLLFGIYQIVIGNALKQKQK